MAKKISAKQLKEETEAANAIANENIRLLERELSKLDNIYNLRRKQAVEEEIINQKRNKQANIDETITKHLSNQDKISKYLLKKYKNQSDAQDKILSKSEKTLDTQKLLLKTVSSLGTAISKNAGIMKTFLMDADASIKNLNLEMGLSGDRSAMMRNNLEDSSMFAARMGIDMKGLTQMVSTYADETGRVRQFNQENLESMTLIAKGTSLGIEGAARMAGQYEMMGFNATDTAGEVQRIVDTTERMGVNTGKVLKAVNSNFKKLQKYSFRNGVKSMADMAIYAEKFKIDMNSVFEPMEKGRRLDSVIEMSAQLQVLGGKFASLADPMSMLFESRNDPEAYMKRINEMTQGMVTLNKTADGFDFALASPMAKDQLSQAAKALGMTTEELTKQAFRMREIQQTRSQMNSKGFTKDEKDIIEGLAKFDKTTGRMFVEIGGIATDVSNIGSDQLSGLKEQSASLKQRALDSQTFDDAMKNTIMELKSTLLPMLNGINSVLEFIRPIVTNISEWFGDLSKTNKDILSGAGAIGAVLMMASPMIRILKGILPSIGGLIGGAGKGIARTATKGVGGLAKGASGAARGGGMAALGKGAGVGVAAVGMGTGIMIAAKGVAALADSMSKLSVEQLESFERVALGLAIAVPLMAAGMLIFGKAAEVSAIGIGILTLAVLGIGAGIGIAAAGIGYMGEGLAMLSGADLSGIGGDLAAIGAATLLFANPITMLGVAGMAASVMAIASSSNGMKIVGDAFTSIGAVMSGSVGQLADVKNTIQSIASTDVSSNSGIGQLVNMLSKPLKVQFSEQEVALVANIDVNVGDSSFYTNIAKKVPAQLVHVQGGSV